MSLNKPPYQSVHSKLLHLALCETRAQKHHIKSIYHGKWVGLLSCESKSIPCYVLQYTKKCYSSSETHWKPTRPCYNSRVLLTRVTRVSLRWCDCMLAQCDRILLNRTWEMQFCTYVYQSWRHHESNMVIAVELFGTSHTQTHPKVLLSSTSNTNNCSETRKRPNTK